MGKRIDIHLSIDPDNFDPVEYAEKLREEVERQKYKPFERELIDSFGRTLVSIKEVELDFITISVPVALNRTEVVRLRDTLSDFIEELNSR